MGRVFSLGLGILGIGNLQEGDVSPDCKRYTRYALLLFDPLLKCDLLENSKSMVDSGKTPQLHPASLSPKELLEGCETQRTRRGGPGGQHRNKTETAIVITHRESGVSGQASERRSQHDNREVAVFRLRLNLAIAIRIEKDIANESLLPSELWRGRVIGGKLQVNVNHADFPTLVAEALDWILTHDFDLATAAGRLGLSTSQLVKFLKLCPEAWQMIQQKRHDRGLPRLK
jgi:hypothetical protein